MKDKGILIGYDGDLIFRLAKDKVEGITRGLTIGNSLYQNQFILLKTHKGELKEFPALGVGLSDMVNDDDCSGWSTTIRLQFEKDGMRVDSVKFDKDRNLEIEACYENK